MSRRLALVCVRQGGFPTAIQGASMKRDLDLCRKILLAVEACPSSPCPLKAADVGVDEGTLNYHLKLLKEKGLLDVTLMEFTGPGNGGRPMVARKINNLT